VPQHHIHALVALIIPLAVGSAPVGAQSLPQPRTRDSAGVQIVEHTTIRGIPNITLIAVASRLDLGGLRADSLAEFDPRNPFLSAARLSDGRLVGTDYASFKILDPAGALIRVVGRAGTGPGEFRQLKGVCITPGDTIIALGYGNRRASVFDASGSHVRDVTFTGYVPTSPCFDDGTFLVATDSRPNPASSFPPQVAAMIDELHTLRRVDKNGSIVGTVGDFRAETYSSGFQTVANSVVRNGLVHSGDGRDPEVRIYTMDGRLVRIIRWNDTPAPVTREMIERRAAGSIPINTSAEERARRIELLLAQPHLPTLPLYSVLEVDAGGRIWLKDPFEAPRPRAWTVFNAEGILLGRTMLPTPRGSEYPAEIAGFFPGQILLRWTDADGAAHLTVHDLALSQ
jgi:hypothetical protein